MYDQKEFLQSQLNKEPEASKKWRMVMFGARGVALIFIFSNLFILLRPELAAIWSSNMQITMYSFSGIVSLYLGAQGVVDYRNSATLATTNSTEKVEIKEEKITKYDEHIKHEGVNAPVIRPFSLHAREDNEDFNDDDKRSQRNV